MSDVEQKLTSGFSEFGADPPRPMEMVDEPVAVAAGRALPGKKGSGRSLRMPPSAEQIEQAMYGFQRAQVKQRNKDTAFRRDEVSPKAKRARSPSADAVLRVLVENRVLSRDQAEALLRSTPRTKGKFFTRIKGTPQGERIREQALATRLYDREALVDELQDLAGPERAAIAEQNRFTKAIRKPKDRRNATRLLYGGSPLSHLLSGQRGYLSKKILDKKSIDPAVAVQLFARQKGGIASATRCAAAVEAARLASRGSYGSATAKYTGGPVTINTQKAQRKSGAAMTPRQKASIYRGLKKLDQEAYDKTGQYTKSGVPRTTTYINKLRGLKVPEQEIQDIIASEPVERKQYARRAASERTPLTMETLQRRLLQEGIRLDDAALTDLSRGIRRSQEQGTVPNFTPDQLRMLAEM
jgi:hypothetical protein